MLMGMKSEGRDRSGRASPGRAQSSELAGDWDEEPPRGQLRREGGMARPRNTTEGWSGEQETLRKAERL